MRAGAALVSLVDVEIPLLGAADLGALKQNAGSAAGREDATGLALLAAIRAGEAGNDADTRREQIRKFSRWSVAARLDWLLAAARLAKGLSPEAKPMTQRPRPPPRLVRTLKTAAVTAVPPFATDPDSAP